ncbi:MFS transporter [Sphingomonas crocodyli]|uniref:MFS transporter n=1 Tax=Sphingomonas crocodyli TaxID=1979270 RepID=A0A437M7P6_9SPHN|nr:MFS transporter [Sphingomonas crocodyli]RVT93514.1 MFS transporter [Sphingomonas crocodyli]
MTPRDDNQLSAPQENMMPTPFSWKARHSVLSVLFITWIVSHMDRMVMSIAIPYIAADFQLSSLASGFVLSAFFAGYSISHIPGGLLADRFGVRRVTTIALLWWSAFTALTGSVGSLAQMLFARLFFGLGEGIFPACAFKTISVWFPLRERATANAIMLSSNALGTALAPLIVVGVMATWGWRAAFHLMFIPGIIIAAIYWFLVADSPAKSRRISPQERAEIEAGSDDKGDDTAKHSLRDAWQQPYILRYFLILFVFDIAFWGFTTWLPTYLVKARGFSLVEMGAAASLPFFAGTLGFIVGGFVSDRLFPARRGVPIIATELISAALLYIMFTTQSTPVLIVCQTLAGFFLSAFFSTFWAYPMNSVPSRMMGVTGGFINMAGQLAAFLSPLAIGYLLDMSSGGFGMTFALMIGSLIVSSIIVLSLPSRVTPATAIA